MEPIQFTVHEPSAELKVAEIKVDLAYQRAIIPARVRKLVNHYDSALVGAILVVRDADGSLTVIDGQHRVQTLRNLGIESVTAEVFEGLSRPDRGRLFLGRNDRSGVSRVDRDRSLATTEDEDTLNIHMASQAAGFVFLAEQAQDSTFRDSATAKIIMTAGERAGHRDPAVNGPAHLQQVLRLYATTYGVDERPESLLLKGLSVVLLTSRQMVDEERITNVLKGIPPQVVVMNAAKLHADLAASQAISQRGAMRRYIVDLYNRGLPVDSAKRLKY
jgi:hypothetical protein